LQQQHPSGRIRTDDSMRDLILLSISKTRSSYRLFSAYYQDLNPIIESLFSKDTRSATSAFVREYLEVWCWCSVTSVRSAHLLAFFRIWTSETKHWQILRTLKNVSA